MESLIAKYFESYDWIGGNLSLDFVNTVGGGRMAAPKEYLLTYPHLVYWAQLAKTVSKTNGEKLLEQFKQRPDSGNEVLNRAQTLREALYRVVTAPTYKRIPTKEDLFLISREASLAAGRARMTPKGNRFLWGWPETSVDLDQVLWPVARSAGDLLTSDSLPMVRECARNGCTWVFLDTSKNHRRRWCVMKDCGNREKVRRFRKKT